jgi:hypothetical protein
MSRWLVPGIRNPTPIINQSDNFVVDLAISLNLIEIYLPRYHLILRQRFS